MIGNLVAYSDDISTLTRQQIQDTVAAYTETNELHRILFTRIAECIESLGGLQTFANTAYTARAFAIQNVDVNIAFSGSFANELPKLDRTELRYLHIYHLWQVGEMNKPGLPKHLQKLCRDAFIESESNHEYSKFHKQINDVLDSLGLKYKNEFRSKAGYSIDIKVEMPNNQKVYIEADGPFHYMSENQSDANFNFGKGREPNFGTVLKRRLVTAIDKVPLVSIPHFEWSESAGLQKKQKYLQRLLGLKDS